MSTFRVDILQNRSGGATTFTNQWANKAWVNFDASSGTPTARSSGNVTSLTDNGVGDFTANFTSALASATYTIGGSCSVTTTGAGSATVVEIYDAAAGGTSPTTSAARIYVHRSGVSAYDASTVCVNILGN